MIRRLARLLGWNAGLIVIAVFTLELAFGGWLKDDPLSSINVFRNVEWRYDVRDRYLGKDSILYRRDEWGLRGEYGNAADINILVLGGSTTDERFIDQGETWTDVLSACLKEHGQTAHIANAGVTGQTTRGHLANFDLWFNRIPGLRPRLYIVYIGINDWFIDSNAEKDDVRRFNEESAPTSSWAVRVQRLKNQSAIYRAYRIAKGQMTAWRAGLAPIPGGALGVDQANNLFSESMQGVFPRDSDVYRNKLAEARQAFAKEAAAYGDRVRQLAEKIRSLDAQPIFVTQSWATYRVYQDRVQGDPNYYFRARAMDEAALKACRETGSDCIDLNDRLSFENGDFWDIVHTTPAGSRRIGDFVCAEILERKIPF